MYFTSNLNVAAWGAELAQGDDPGKIYVVSPTGDWDDDPNVTDKMFSGNPTNSYRTTSPLEVIGRVLDWQGHSRKDVELRRQQIARLLESGVDIVED